MSSAPSPLFHAVFSPSPWGRTISVTSSIVAYSVSIPNPLCIADVVIARISQVPFVEKRIKAA